MLPVPPLPPGVTKRHLDTLNSRGTAFTVGGTAVVCCVHGRVKRENADGFVVDLAIEKPHICPCCQNLYAKPSDEPGPCPACTPRRVPT